MDPLFFTIYVFFELLSMEFRFVLSVDRIPVAESWGPAIPKEKRWEIALPLEGELIAKLDVFLYFRHKRHA